MPTDDKTLPNPLPAELRQVLLRCARVAKERDLLTPWQRKALYQAGRYDDWFASRFRIIPEILMSLRPELDLAVRDDCSRAAQLISRNAPVEGDAKSGTTAAEIRRLATLVEAQAASPAERLSLAELLEQASMFSEALEVADALRMEYPANTTVETLTTRLRRSVGRR
jgi:hypothetical protein